MRGLHCRVVLALLAITAPHVWGLYEDQAGTFDWHKQFIGRVVSSSYIPAKDRLYVATAQNLVAALSAKDGSIAWRRLFTEADPLGKILVLQRPDQVITGSRGGRYVRAWDAKDGSFLWERGVEAAAAAGAFDIAALAPGKGGKGAVAVAAAGTLQLYDSAKGGLLWSAEVAAAAAGSQVLVASGEDDTLIVVGYTPGSTELSLAAFSAVDGAPAWTTTATTSAPLGLTASVSGAALALLSSSGSELCTLLLAEGAEASCQPLTSIAAGVALGGDSALLPAAPATFVLRSGTTGVALVSVTASGAHLLAEFPAATAASPGVAADGSHQLAVAAADGAAGVTLTLVDAASGATLSSTSAQLPAPGHPSHGVAPRPAAAWLCEPSAAAADADAVVAVAWDDHSLALVRGGSVAWQREEALASVKATLFVDLPAASRGAAAAAAVPAAATAGGAKGGGAGFVDALAALAGTSEARLRSWARMQLLGVLVQFKLAAPEEAAEFLELRQSLSTKNLLVRDANRFRQMILALTEPGKLLALHNGDGRVLWTHNLGPRDAPSHLLPWRRFHDLTHAPQVALLRASGAAAAAASDGGAHAHVIDVHTGAALAALPLGSGRGAPHQVVPLHAPLLDGHSEQELYLLLGPPPTPSKVAADPAVAPAVALLPDTPEARSALAARASTTFFWQLLPVDAGAPGAVLAGFGVQAPAAGGDAAVAVPVWRVPLRGRVLSLTSRGAGDVLHSAVKVLGDRSMLFKYANPNTLLALTGSAERGGARAAPWVAATLVDTVTGAVLHQQRHEGAAGPALAVASEHWAAYTVQDVASGRQQAVVMELYDATPRDTSLPAVLAAVTGLGGAAGSAGEGGGAGAAWPGLVSSYEGGRVSVLTQAFWLPLRAKLLAVTQTQQGITSKQLLIGTVTDQVYAMDKRFLDPRRPMHAKLTAAETEERLIPYSDTLPFTPLAYLTFDKQVAQLRGVSVAPAGLESTCLVLVTGADLFYSRVTPSRHFDSLEADFSYGLLVVALLMLAIGSVVVRFTSNKAVLKAKWQ